jgi:hypothetical protein
MVEAIFGKKNERETFRTEHNTKPAFMLYRVG